MICFLAQFSDKPCEGRLIRAHLIPRQQIRNAVRYDADLSDSYPWTDDERSWVWACGGTMGNSGHHGALDTARTLHVPRSVLPAGLEEFAAELGLTYWLEREYGPLEEAA